ncbi:hypothetical protein H7R52_04300 [Weissella confusa]|uniref:Uncharacterized protein n=1 Tax=Weissella confusa TaxID=1583 RepID=A0A923SMR9_WEICO|nr:hypothetical protein [Weissella confusa]
MPSTNSGNTDQPTANTDEFITDIDMSNVSDRTSSSAPDSTGVVENVGDATTPAEDATNKVETSASDTSVSAVANSVVGTIFTTSTVFGDTTNSTISSEQALISTKSSDIAATADTDTTPVEQVTIDTPSSEQAPIEQPSETTNLLVAIIPFRIVNFF